MKKNSLLSGFRVAFNGILQLIRHERNFQIHTSALILVIIFGFWLKISRNEWIDLLLISSLVLALEAINTSLEKICDLVNPEWDDRIKVIKDVAAGAVLIASLFAIAIGIFTFLPYFL